MAAIDKTYVKTWEEYDKIAEWSKGKIIYNNPSIQFGIYHPKIYLSSCLYLYNSSDREHIKKNPNYGIEPLITVWNTSHYTDKWLAQNCPFDIIQNTLKDQYQEDYPNLFTSLKEEDKSNWITPKINFNENDFYICKRFQIEVYYNKDKSDWPWTYDFLNHKWYTHEEEISDIFHSQEFFKGTPTKRKINRILSKWKLPKGVYIIITTFLPYHQQIYKVK